MPPLNNSLTFTIIVVKDLFETFRARVFFSGQPKKFTLNSCSSGNTSWRYTMKLFDFYEQALKSEQHDVSFLQSFGIFDSSSMLCPGKQTNFCGNLMSQIRMKSRKAR